MIKALNIALVTDCYYPHIGGVEYCVEALAKELLRLGHGVTVITGGVANGIELHHGITIKRLSGAFLAPHLRWSKKHAALAALLKSGAFDVIHAHSLFSPLAIAAVKIARRLHIPHVMTLHSLYGGFSAWAAAWMLRPVKQAIGVSHAVTAMIKKLHPLSQAYYIPNGFDVPTMEKTVPSLANPSVKIIGTVSRLTKKKAVDRFVHLAALLLANNPQLKFMIVGAGPEQASLMALSRRLKIEDHLIFVGGVSRAEVFKRMQQMDIFVLTSPLEAFGMVVLEAMYNQVPVVAWNSQGITDIIESGKNGYLATSQTEMKVRIQQLLDHPAEVKRITDQALQELEKFSWVGVTQQTIALYHELITK